MTVGARQRLRVRVEGTVQGVGFRPFVYRVATELGLAGWVLNDSRGVLIEAEGERDALDALLERMRTDAPPLAIVERIADESVAATGETDFCITESADGGDADAAVSPDVATCDDCLAELFDPADRRHRYPFTNCTNCGPRFTIVRGVPYDRPLTTMASFVMCARCRAEYEDPLDRRFHAQPNACPVCGPQVRLLERDGSPVDGGDPVRAARPFASSTVPAGCSPTAMRARSRRRSWRWRRGASSRSRGSADITSPVAPTTSPWWPSCAPASTARTSPSP